MLIPVLLVPLALAAPSMTTVAEGGVSLRVPDDFKAWIDVERHSATASLGLATSIRLYWYDFKRKLTLDESVDIILRVTQENVPFGRVEPRERVSTLGGFARVQLGQFGLLGYRMRVDMLAINDPVHDRMVAAVLIAPPESYDDAAAVDLLASVAASLRTDGDEALEQRAMNPPERLLYRDPPGSLLP